MDLNAVRLFVSVVQAGSLSKACEQLNVPIATVSRQLKQLEKTLGVQLLDRFKTGVKPTVQGQLFYEQVYLNIDGLIYTERNFQEEKQQLNGVLRLSLSIGMEAVWERIAAFQERYPDVQIYCQATDDVVDLVADGIDVAIRTGDLHTDSVVAVPFMQVKAMWVASPDLLARLGTPQTPQDLLNYPCAGFGRPGQKTVPYVWQTAQGQQGALEIPCRFLSNDNHAVLHLAQTGKAVCPLADSTARKHIAQGELCHVLPDYPFAESYPINALYLPHRHQSAVVKAFIAFLKETAAGEEGGIIGALPLRGRQADA